MKKLIMLLLFFAQPLLSVFGQTPSPAAPAGAVIIYVKADGAISINRRTLSRPELISLLKSLLQMNKEQAAVICGDEACPYKVIADVTDVCHDAGITNVALAIALKQPSGTLGFKLLTDSAGFASVRPQPATNVLTADESVPIPKLTFDAKGDLAITASATSSPSDFDFLVGKWKMHNRHLDKRLADCKTWTEFDSSSVNTKIIADTADMDTYSTTEFPGQNGKLFEGLTLRLFDPKTRLWSLYWIASNTGTIDPPVVGSFENGVGHFFGKDTLNGKPIMVMFRWDARNKDRPVWGQAFSADNGNSWEWNFFNVSTRP